MVKVKIAINRDECIGCGTCVATCPSGNWELRDDGKAMPKNAGECDYALQCQNNCPVKCITVTKL